jgi:hypothetical protein
MAAVEMLEARSFHQLLSYATSICCSCIILREMRRTLGMAAWPLNLLCVSV